MLPPHPPFNGRGLADSGPDGQPGPTRPLPRPLTCAALATGRFPRAPGRASSTSVGRRHSAPSTAPRRRARSWAPDAAEGTQAPRPMAPAESLSGLRRRGSAAAARVTALRGRARGCPEGNQLAACCREHPRHLQPGVRGPGPVGRWRWPGQGQLGGVTWRGWGWCCEEGPGRQGRDGHRGLGLRQEWSAGSPDSLRVD